MRIILNTIINNPDLPVINPVASLISSSMIAGYSMTSNKDFSGKGNHFTWNGSFDSSGAVLANDANHVISLPFADTTNMTVIFCWNVAAAASGSNRWLYGNSKPGTSGSTIIDGVFHRATGSNVTMGIGTAGGGSSLAAQSTGAWTMQAHRFSETTIERITRAGAVTQASVTGRVAGASPIYVNGQPSSVNANYSSGSAGNLGMMLFYNELTDNSTLATRMETISSIMSGRGVTIP